MIYATDSRKDGNSVVAVAEHEATGQSNGSPASRDAAYSLLILSEIRFLREALKELLERDQFHVIGADLESMFHAIAAGLPDVVLIDTNLPDGPLAVSRIRPLAPDARFVALAIPDDEPEVLKWAQAGISGYILQDASLGDIIGQLKQILRGEQACSRQVAAGLLRWIASGSGPAAREAVRDNVLLTTREQEVARLLTAGCSNKEIARRLDVSLGTTKSHVHNVLGKLNVTHRSEVSRWMRQHAAPLWADGSLPPTGLRAAVGTKPRGVPEPIATL